LIGSAEARLGIHRELKPSLRLVSHRYVAVDGGSGAHLLAAVAGWGPQLRAVISPRHADLLIIVTPVAARLRVPLEEIVRSLPNPAWAFVAAARFPQVPEQRFVSIDRVVRNTQRGVADAKELIDALCNTSSWRPMGVVEKSGWVPDTISLPTDTPELQTEFVVHSFGPIQPITSGPLRFLVVCDGEQVVRVEVECGYTFRGIAEAMTAAPWKEAAALAAELDPLAPVACRLAYVRALEAIQGYAPPENIEPIRESALAIERARNNLWWLVRFLDIIAAPALFRRAHDIASRLDQCVGPPTTEWIAPQYCGEWGTEISTAKLQLLARDVSSLEHKLNDDPWLRFRTKDIGVLTLEQALQRRISGPVLVASQHGRGDVHARITARLRSASSDLGSESKMRIDSPPDGQQNWRVPSGKATVAIPGPRGAISLGIESDGGTGPIKVEWQRPSRALLTAVPGLLRNQKLADAEVILASLDIATAEADG